MNRSTFSNACPDDRLTLILKERGQNYAPIPVQSLLTLAIPFYFPTHLIMPESFTIFLLRHLHEDF